VARRAWLDLMLGQPARAQQRLDELRAQHPIEHAEDRALVDRVRAQIRLACGDAAGTLQILAPYGDAPNAETWALILALRLQARAALGQFVAGDLERASADLGAKRLPALDGLVLQLALIEALAAAGDPAGAERQRELGRTARDRMAASLAGWPQQRSALLARFAALG
jgi:hypothetical protein